MGSVQEYGLKCPICGKNRLLSDYYYQTQEHYEFCEACGFQQSITILRDDARYRSLLAAPKGEK